MTPPARLWPSLVVAALAAAAGCSSPGKMCTGARIRCYNYTAQGCASFDGCTTMPNCALLDNQGPVAACGLKTTQATCAAAPKCSWTGTACVDTCSTIRDQSACNNNPGEHDQNQALLWSCKWAECAGEPKIKYCSDYSISMCPAGCAVLTNCQLGACP